ncbi:hypothetical protein, partial [Streptomyces ipomoeae]|uniref:hypothetical protein n=1 Tax=Streptomyces ipomoeae TaxID=103232 RepID=UPI001F1D83E0
PEVFCFPPARDSHISIPVGPVTATQTELPEEDRKSPLLDYVWQRFPDTVRDPGECPAFMPATHQGEM